MKQCDGRNQVKRKLLICSSLFTTMKHVFVTAKLFATTKECFATTKVTTCCGEEVSRNEEKDDLKD